MGGPKEFRRVQGSESKGVRDKTKTRASTYSRARHGKRAMPSKARRTGGLVMDGLQMGMDNTGCSIMGRSQIIGHRLAVQGKGPESKRKHPSKSHCHCRTSIPH